MSKDHKVFLSQSWVGVRLTTVEKEDSIKLVEVLLQDFFDFLQVAAEGSLDLALLKIFIQTLQKMLFGILFELGLENALFFVSNRDRVLRENILRRLQIVVTDSFDFAFSRL